MNRRNFIQSGAILGGGLLISFTIPQANKLANYAGSANGSFKPNAFLKIGSDNSILVYLSHVEMGQGIWTTLPMLIADELDVDLERIIVQHGSADKAFNHTGYGIQITGGSSSTWSEFDRYRNAGATARILLLQAAAAASGVPVAECSTASGMVTAGNKRYTYGELADASGKLAVPGKVPLRAEQHWRYIGKGTKRLDARVKTNGQAQFGIDVKLPGLLTAVVAHAPVFGGKIKSFNADQARQVSGVREIVEIPTGVAVLADHYWAATQGRKMLKIEWESGPGENLDTKVQTATYRKTASRDGLTVQKKGDEKSRMVKASHIHSAEYVFPYLAHAPMEPINCTVSIDKDVCEIWTGTQLPGGEQATAAKILGFSPEQVKINVPFLGGGFGRRATPASDFVSEAVHIAKVSGKKIKMVWSREDDLKSGYYRPFCVHKIKVGTDQNGHPIAWNHNIVSQSIMADATALFGPAPLIDDTSVEGVKGSPYLSGVADHFVGLHTTKEVVPVLWYRSVGGTHTGYVMETLIDELAHKAGRDPLIYRRELLKDHPRHLSALNLVADKGKWNASLPKGQFKGIAVHEAFGSYVAIIARISIVENAVKVHQIDCAIDCGLAVNPDGVRAQMESGIIFGQSMAVYGELTIKGGVLQQNNFYDYRITRMHEAPKINVYIVESREKMGGAGECAVPPTAPAIANAIFAASGVRIYDLPFINHKLKNI